MTEATEFHLHLHDGVTPEAVKAAIDAWRDGSSDESMATVEEAIEEESPEAMVALAKRAYRESNGKMNPLLDFLADNPDRAIPFTEATTALGFDSARSMPGLLGAFGRRANHRYDGKWPFKTMWQNGAWHMLMTQEAAEAIRELRTGK